MTKKTAVAIALLTSCYGFLQSRGSAPSLDTLSYPRCEICTLSPTQFVLDQRAVPRSDSAEAPRVLGRGVGEEASSGVGESVLA